jgi:hypothetical protein
MKLFRTTDVSASVHAAYRQFTHIALNRGYTLIRPVHFRTALLDDLPIFQYASWIPSTASQVAAWQGKGGVLIEQDTVPKNLLAPDVTVMVECPYTMARIEACCARNTEYGVIPNPMSWSTHEECVNLRFPTQEALERLWRVAAGQSMNDSDLAAEAGYPIQHVRYMRNSLAPIERWTIHKRLAPDQAALMPAWDWIPSGDIDRAKITKAGCRVQIEEMARLGNIGLKRLHHYPTDEPDWDNLTKRRETALTDLASVRSLLETLPDHPVG